MMIVLGKRLLIGDGYTGGPRYSRGLRSNKGPLKNHEGKQLLFAYFRFRYSLLKIYQEHFTSANSEGSL